MCNHRSIARKIKDTMSYLAQRTASSSQFSPYLPSLCPSPEKATNFGLGLE